MEKSSLKPEVVNDVRCLLGEGPLWDDETQTIYWLDIVNKNIHWFSPTNQNGGKLTLEQMPGAIALYNKDEFIAGLEKGIYFVNKKTGALREISQPESHLPDNRCNDGKCDTSGRFWIGTMPKSEDCKTGSLYMLEDSRHPVRKVSDTTISNGLAWSPDDKTFYFIDTGTGGVDAFDYDSDTGEITNRRQVIAFEKEDGFPDGMTIDDEGMLWVAHWGGWQVSRWNPSTGKKLLSVTMPVANVSSCTFGGEDLSDLYIITASKGLKEEDREEQPLAGALFVVRNSGFKGLPSNRFKK